MNERPPEYKVVIMGDSGIGKTSIVQWFNTQTFDASKDITIGASFVAKTLTTAQGDVKINLWDTAGQERYRSLIPTYARTANAAVICFDLTSLTSFEALERWIANLHNFSSPDCLIYIVGNKCDLELAIPIESAKQWASTNNYTFFVTSAKTGENVLKLFETIAEDLAEKSKPQYVKPFNLETPKAKKRGCCS